MNELTLIDETGGKVKAQVLFTFFDYFFSKSYIVYSIDNDVLAASYETQEDKYILDHDLTSNEYDMIDKEIEKRSVENEIYR